MDFIEYADGYKYQLLRNYYMSTYIIPNEYIRTDFIDLGIDGFLSIREGYAWDGPSGPTITIDTLNFMRGSLVHDAFYELMREGYLNHNKYRLDIDTILKEICIEDGMSSIRAWFVFKAVRIFGEPSANPKYKKPSIYAPRKPSIFK